MLQSMRYQQRTAFLKALPHCLFPHFLQIPTSLLTAFLFLHSLKHLQCIKTINNTPQRMSTKGDKWVRHWMGDIKPESKCAT